MAYQQYDQQYVPQKQSRAADLVVVFFVLIALWGAAAYFLNNRSTFNTAEEDINVPTPGSVAASLTSDPEDFIGMTAEEVTSEISTPDEVAQNSDGSREIWAYIMSDRTGQALVLFFENGVVQNAIEDEFDGSFDAYTWLE